MKKKIIWEGERPREPLQPRDPYAREGERPREPQICEPPLLPARHHPSTNSVHTISFRSTILFVTICTEGKKPILASPEMVAIIVSAWAHADKWVVGQYVIMPDHIHFFCSPATYPPYDFHKWIAYWKRLTTQAAARGDAAAREDARTPARASASRTAYGRVIRKLGLSGNLPPGELRHLPPFATASPVSLDKVHIRHGRH